jgi:hypothetical protein
MALSLTKPQASDWPSSTWSGTSTANTSLTNGSSGLVSLLPMWTPPSPPFTITNGSTTTDLKGLTWTITDATGGSANFSWSNVSGVGYELIKGAAFSGTENLTGSSSGFETTTQSKLLVYKATRSSTHNFICDFSDEIFAGRLSMFFNNSGQLVFKMSSSTTVYTSTVTIPNNLECVIAVAASKGSGASGSIKICINDGTSVSSVESATVDLSAWNAGTGNVRSIFERSGDDWSNNVGLAFYAEWNVALSNANLTSLATDPYQIIRPITTYTLTSAQGSFILTGKAATLTGPQRVLSTAQGNFTLTGKDATLRATGAPLTLTAAQASYTLTGESVGFITNVLANVGAYTLTGFASLSLKHVTVTTSNGTFTLTGFSASRQLGALAGSYLARGFSAGGLKNGVSVEGISRRTQLRMRQHIGL